MENIVILAVLIVVMEFAVEQVKNILSNISIWEKIKSFLIPIINIIAMTALILGTKVTILSSLGITCNIYVDIVFTILICSLGTASWHEFKKKIKEVTKQDEAE